MNGLLRYLRYSAWSTRDSDIQYELVPSDPAIRSTQVTTSRRSSNRSLPWLRYCQCSIRRVLLLLLLLLSLLVFIILAQGIPPDFADIRAFERSLPQHNLSLQNIRSLRFPDHLWGHGLNNVLQQTLLFAYIAYAANRSFVFEDYVWSHTPFPYTIYDFALRPTRMPMNAFIAGPVAGGPSHPDSAPLAVSAEFWEQVCPKSVRRTISSRDAPANSSQEEGSVMVDWWLDTLSQYPDSCLQVESSSVKIFEHSFFSSSRILSIWPALSASPPLSLFAWSPLVHSGVLRNFPLLHSSSAHTLLNTSSPLPGLVAVHLRRGDYIRHCPRLAHWRLPYTGFNQHPALPDRFTPPDSNTSSSEVESYYLQHCFPTITQVVRRLHDIRASHHAQDLTRVYVLTNAWSWWLASLKSALRDDGWLDLTSSLDLVLDSEQKWVSMAIDMAIAERAQVFVGNGFSSLSSNIIMLRAAKGLDMDSNRFL